MDTIDSQKQGVAFNYPVTAIDINVYVNTLQHPFCKAGYRPVSVQCLNSTPDSTILMIVLEVVI